MVTNMLPLSTFPDSSTDLIGSIQMLPRYPDWLQPYTGWGGVSAHSINHNMINKS